MVLRSDLLARLTRVEQNNRVDVKRIFCPGKLVLLYYNSILTDPEINLIRKQTLDEIEKEQKVILFTSDEPKSST